MRINKIFITFKTQEKIFKKHHITRTQIESVFLDDTLYLRSRNKRYVAIGYVNDYITIIFQYNNGIAEIVTAYKSSEWQKKLYKVKKWKK